MKSHGRSDAKTDGRHQRTQATRNSIISAAIALQQEGIARPSAQQISERAGISPRSVFQHFPAKDELTRAVLTELTRVNRIDPPPVKLAEHSALDSRIEQFLDIRCQQLENLTPHRMASNSLIAESHVLQVHRLKVRRRYRRETESWFAVEFDTLSKQNRERWLVAIASLVDWEMWQSLRTYPTRSVPAARASMSLLLRAALKEIARGEP